VGGRGVVNVKVNVNGSCWKLESGRAFSDSSLVGGGNWPPETILAVAIANLTDPAKLATWTM